MEKIPMHSRPTLNVAHPRQMLAFTGSGFIPDLASEGSLQTFPEACHTTLEEGVYGAEGMLPPPGHVNRPLQPGYKDGEGGTGGAGSFNTRVAAPPQLL